MRRTMISPIPVFPPLSIHVPRRLHPPQLPRPTPSPPLIYRNRLRDINRLPRRGPLRVPARPPLRPPRHHPAQHAPHHRPQHQFAALLDEERAVPRREDHVDCEHERAADSGAVCAGGRGGEDDCGAGEGAGDAGAGGAGYADAWGWGGGGEARSMIGRGRGSGIGGGGEGRGLEEGGTGAETISRGVFRCVDGWTDGRLLATVRMDRYIHTALGWNGTATCNSSLSSPTQIQSIDQ
jgi:hypothetical protein